MTSGEKTTLTALLQRASDAIASATTGIIPLVRVSPGSHHQRLIDRTPFFLFITGSNLAAKRSPYNRGST
ncbi:hypothetical protein D3C73_1523780 [compost metagenome]